MNKEELFKKISSASEASANAKEMARQKQINEVKALYETALTFLPRVKDLCELIQYASNKGYYIDTHHHGFFSKKGNNPRLRTDGIDHTLGFYDNLQSIGNEAGGYDGTHDFIVTLDDIGMKCGNTFTSFKFYDLDLVSYRDYYWRFPAGCLKSFVNGGFEEFERQVMDFIENIDQYTCHIK